MLYATVRNRKIHVKKPDTVVQNGVKVDWLQLEMDDEWAEMDSIVCVFVARYTEEQTGDGGTKTLVEQEIKKEMLHTFGQKVLVPWEVLVNSGMLSVSCTGYVGSEKIMTTMYPDSFWQIVQNGPKSGDSSIEPTASLYDQILAASGAANAAAIAATQAREQLMQDKANGVFDGADGKAATVEVGTVITGSPEENAQVYATGTPQEVRLNFVLPRGKQGPAGPKGETGPAGPQGQQGVQGETGNTGPQGPKGEKGDKGDTGDAGPIGPSGVYVGSGDMPDGYNVQIDPSGDASIKVDTTLTKPGQAADAAAVGNRLSSLSEEIHAVDSALSDTSENPVQNKVIKSALDAKVGTEELNKNSETLGTLTVKDSDGNVLGVYDGGSKEIVIPASTGGGGSHAWNLITNLSVSDAQTEHQITVDDSGNAFAYDEILVLYPSPAISGYLYFRGGVDGAESTNCKIWLTAGKGTLIQFSLMGGYVGISSVIRADGPVGFSQGLGGNATMDKIRTIVIGASAGFTAAGTIRIYGR